MGKKGNGWFSSVKKVFKNSSKDLPEKKKDNFDKWQPETPEVVSFEHFPAPSSPDITNEDSDDDSSLVGEDRIHAMTVAVATAAAAEAAVAAAQAAAKVVRLAGYGRQSKEERAATLIQSYYRGYLVTFLSLSLSLTEVSFFTQLYVIKKSCQNPYLVTQ